MAQVPGNVNALSRPQIHPGKIMLNSVRFRLTFYYTVAFALVLLVLAFSMYAVLKSDNVKRVDTDISQLADSFLTTVHAELKDQKGPDPVKLSIDEAIAEHSFRDYLFAVFGTDGKLVESSGANFSMREKGSFSSEVFFASPSFQTLLAGSNGPAQDFADLKAGGEHFRGYARRFVTPYGNYVLVVLFSLRQPEEFLESIRHTFALIIPLGILLASAGGYFLARKSLAPVASMSQQASKIDATNLDDRLAVVNARDELGTLAQSFNQLLDRLARSIDQQRRFMADASHELRTPIAILRGEADVALSRPERSTGEYRESLQILREEARRLSQIVENLFTLARADAGNYPLTKSHFYLDELLADCVRAARTLAAIKNIRLENHSEEELLLEADEALIHRMVLNLIDNAIKFTQPGGAVSVGARRQGGGYLISVKDTGAGIPSELQPRVFERFFRADKARTHQKDAGTGAGLGLAISRWIAEAHQGTLELSSSNSQGSVFAAYLQGPPKSQEIPSPVTASN
jgi:two-component system OmpR family sensor kinase